MFFSDAIYKQNENDVEQITKFLKENDVTYDFPEKTYVIRDNGEIVATGSVDGNILKYFYSKDEYKGQGLMAIIFQSLLNYLIENGRDSFFVFTKPKNVKIFASLGLKEIITTEYVSLFEGGFYNYKSWIKKTKEKVGPKKGKRGTIIMNCNPMTLGHKYLIETALKEVDELIVFLVEEDKSVFPFKDRYEIVSKELKEFKNVKVIPSGPYMISRGTFPTYFLKEKDNMLEIYTELDGTIFAKKIGKDLEIDVRFLGTEPTDQVTLQYNRSLEKILQANDIEVKIVKRKEMEDSAISASRVRYLLKDKKEEEAFKFLPNSTIEYLKSEKGKEIINNLQNV